MRFIAASDIHGNARWLFGLGAMARNMEADVILIAGDVADSKEYRQFGLLLRDLSEHAGCPVIVTPGNHDYWEGEFPSETKFHKINHFRRPYDYCMQSRWNDDTFHQRPTGVVSLIDDSIVYKGVKIYGTPWVNECGNWNWQRPKPEMRFDIPQDTDILLAHSPPFGCGDCIGDGNFIGSEAMEEAILKTPNLQFVFFGHCHEQSGWRGRIGSTSLYNVSLTDGRGDGNSQATYWGAIQPQHQAK